ncbi:class I SAM-dependent methyltransferase [Natronosalvus vescus]|uniref:class I SAM-dependent methyltransferase n=1 Tax=Natronosalvus vescus TaxID=2953881 RepID=UPI002090864F|nr:methyltransferase domain-containing protein [Natronosalvus vescus]
MSTPTPSLEVLLLLRAARETGALEALMTSAETPEALAAETDLTPRAATTLVSVLETEGFLERVDDTYEPTNRSLGFLAKTDVRSIGSLPATLDRLDRSLELASTMRGDDPDAMTDIERRNRLGALAAVDESTVRAIVTELVHVAPDARRVLEIGGTPGRHAAEFAARGFDVTVYDRPEHLVASRGVLAPADVETLEGTIPDGLADTLAGVDRFDLVTAVEQSHRFGPDANERLIEAGIGVLRPGGSLALVTPLEGDAASRATVDALTTTVEGRCHASETYRGWLETAGLEAVSIRSVPGAAVHVVTGRKPDATFPAGGQ